MGESVGDSERPDRAIWRDHLPWMERKIEGAELGRCIIGMMPKCNGAEGRSLIRELSKAGVEPGLGDVPYVLFIDIETRTRVVTPHQLDCRPLHFGLGHLVCGRCDWLWE